MATRPKFAKMANYSCECVEASHIFLKKPLANVSECNESRQSRVANVGKCIESGQSRLANVGECIESGQFSKMTILASTRIRQICRRVAIA